MNILKSFVLSTVTSLIAIPALATSYEVDKAHTHVGFKIDHLMISEVHGRFNDFHGTFEFDEKTKKLSNVNFTVKTASIDTNQADRDKHLRTADFFNVEKYPEMTFVSTDVKNKKGKPDEITGNLTILGVTKKVTFDLDYEGITKDGWGNQVLAWKADIDVNRKDFGMTWNQKLDQGGFAVGDKVEIELAGEAKLKAAAAPAAAPATGHPPAKTN